jgi:O-methyltransferase involved in polyketide biosynthesis
MVVNLAAVLDTRPYRMQLPASLKWIEVDLPEILAYKEELLKTEKPACTLERVRTDCLMQRFDVPCWADLPAKPTKVLVITEGLLTYLQAEEVSALAEDLKRSPAFKRWVLDMASPGLLRMLQKNTHQQFGSEVPPLQFAPADGPACFAQSGWNAIEVHSMLKTAGLKRLTFVMRLLALLPENPKTRSLPWSGVCLFASQ